MHSVKINKTQFHYNSDMSGEVVIIVNNQQVRVEADDLVEFVLDRLRDQKISELEDMDTADIKRRIINAI